MELNAFGPMLKRMPLYELKLPLVVKHSMHTGYTDKKADGINIDTLHFNLDK